MSDAPIDRLRRIAAALEGGAVPAAADATWLADAITRYALGARDGLTLDRELGLVAKPGSRPWWRTEERARREASVTRVAAEYFNDLPPTAAASEILRAWNGQRVTRDDSEASRRAAAKRPAARRRLAELIGLADDLPSTRQLRRSLRATGHELDEVLAKPTDYVDGGP
jgi:hypothetical protein